MGTASWLVWHNGGWQHHSAALTMYAVQLALNLSWPPLFFSGHKVLLLLLLLIVCFPVAMCIFV